MAAACLRTARLAGRPGHTCKRVLLRDMQLHIRFLEAYSTSNETSGWLESFMTSGALSSFEDLAASH